METDANQLAAAIYEAECGQPPHPAVMQMAIWRARVELARKTLAILERDYASASPQVP